MLLDEGGTEIQGEGEGYLVFSQPWPGMMRTVFNDHPRFESTYFSKFPGYYCTGDGELIKFNFKLYLKAVLTFNLRCTTRQRWIFVDYRSS